MSALHFHESCRSVVVLSRLSGLFIPYDGANRTGKVFNISSIILYMFLIWKTICGTSAIFNNAFQDRIISQSTDVHVVSGLMLMLLYRIFGARLEELIVDIDNICQNIIQKKLGTEDNFIKIYTEYTKLLANVMKMLVVSSTVCPLLYCASSVVVYYILGGEELLLPLPNNCEFETSYRMLYEVFAFFQFSALSIPAYQKLGNDFLLFQMMQIQVNCFKYINDSFREIEKCMNNDPGFSPRANIVDCIKIHQHIIRNVKELQSLFSPVVVLYLLGIITLAANELFYQLNADDINLVQAGTLATYMFITIFQFYLLCYMADEITLEAEKVSFAAYGIPWYMLDKDSRILICMTINLGQRKLGMTAYNTQAFSISKEAFVHIMVNVISAYMGFKKIKDIE
nr:olfactory receptor 80 [Tropidothorax elegans]